MIVTEWSKSLVDQAVRQALLEATWPA